MPLSINTNMAATRASFYLSKNNNMLQQSLDRLSSGKRINNSSDDAGGLAVSMKMQGTIDRLSGADKNIGNAISFLQVQDGILESAGKIVSRMGELKGLYGDVLNRFISTFAYTTKASHVPPLANLSMNPSIEYLEINSKVLSDHNESDCLARIIVELQRRLFGLFLVLHFHHLQA